METVVITFGRCQGPHIGHEMLFNFCRDKAAELGGDYKIFPTKTCNKDNPIPYDVKLTMLRLLMPSHIDAIVQEHDGAIIKVVQSLQADYKRLVFVCGSDRVDSFRDLLARYNNVEYSFDDIQVISCGDRNETGNITEQASASKVRAFVAARDFAGYSAIAPRGANAHAIASAFIVMGSHIESREAVPA